MSLCSGLENGQKGACMVGNHDPFPKTTQNIRILRVPAPPRGLRTPDFFRFRFFFSDRFFANLLESQSSKVSSFGYARKNSLRAVADWRLVTGSDTPRSVSNATTPGCNNHFEYSCSWEADLGRRQKTFTTTSSGIGRELPKRTTVGSKQPNGVNG